MLSWLANAEAEYGRRPFAGILALENPNRHEAVLVSDQIGPGSSRWAVPSGVSIPRTPAAIALALTAMLTHCAELHLVDPHFGPQNARHRRVLEALLEVVADSAGSLRVIRVHCGDNVGLVHFESEAALMTTRLPTTINVEFVRWRKRDGGDDLHNRYVLTDVGGVQFGTGLDDGRSGETDDVTLMARAQYDLRWSQRPRDRLRVRRPPREGRRHPARAQTLMDCRARRHAPWPAALPCANFAQRVRSPRRFKPSWDPASPERAPLRG